MTKDTKKWSSSACTNVCETVIGMLEEAGFKEDHSNLLEMLNQVKFVPIGSVAVTGTLEPETSSEFIICNKCYTKHTLDSHCTPIEEQANQEAHRQSRPDDTT